MKNILAERVRNTRTEKRVPREIDAEQCTSIISLDNGIGFREMKHKIQLHAFLFTLWNGITRN